MSCKHKWHLGKIVRYSNDQSAGWSEWACDKCGEFKELKFSPSKQK